MNKLKLKQINNKELEELYNLWLEHPDENRFFKIFNRDFKDSKKSFLKAVRSRLCKRMN